MKSGADQLSKETTCKNFCNRNIGGWGTGDYLQESYYKALALSVGEVQICKEEHLIS